MRNSNRIDPFLKELGEYWKKVPDWRFGQLLSNVLSNRKEVTDIFFLEENKFLEYFREFFNEDGMSKEYSDDEE